MLAAPCGQRQSTGRLSSYTTIITEESKVGECGWREKARERKGGRWSPQQKIVKWVSVAGERDREREGERGGVHTIKE